MTTVADQGPMSRRRRGGLDDNPGEGLDCDPVALGEVLRRLRITAHLSLADVAGDDVSPAFLGQVEHGAVRPTRRRLEAIAERLGVELEAILAATPTRDERSLAAIRIAQARVALGLGQAARVTGYLERLPGALTDHDSAVVAHMLGMAQMLAGDLAAADQTIARGLERVGSDDPRTRLILLALHGDVHRRAGEVALAHHILSEGSGAEDGPGVDPAARCYFLTCRGRCSLAMNDVEQAVSEFAAALDSFAQPRQVADVVDAVDSMVEGLIARGMVAEAARMMAQPLLQIDLLAMVALVGRAYCGYADGLLRAGRPTEAGQAYRHAAHFCAVARRRSEEARALAGAAEAALAGGDPAAGRELAERSSSVLNSMDPAPGDLLCQVSLLLTEVGGEQPAEALVRLVHTAAVVEAASGPAPQALGRVSLRIAEMLRFQGHTEEALAWALRGRPALEESSGWRTGLPGVDLRHPPLG